jgi:hypothetical protein
MIFNIFFAVLHGVFLLEIKNSKFIKELLCNF